MIEVFHYSDPGCPWAYSASPALAVLRWRYGEQLRWRHVMIGLAEDPERYTRRGYTPLAAALGQRRFHRYGMPFAPRPRDRIIATSPACRAVVATRLRYPDRELAVFRALQFAWFTTPGLLDEAEPLRAVLDTVPGVDAEAVVGELDAEEVVAAYESDRAQARAAGGAAAELQGKTAQTDGPVRYTAPSLVFSSGGARLEAGGFQPVEAYDVLLANLDPTLSREAPPERADAVLRSFPDGLTTQEVAAVLTAGNEAPDRAATENALIELSAGRAAERIALGDDALWRPVTP